MAFPYSIKFIYRFLEVIGCKSEYRYKRRWQNLLMRVHCFIYTAGGTLALFLHLISTTTRAIRYLPEFFQRLMEDLGFIFFYVECCLFKYNFKSFCSLMEFMKNNFSSVERNIVEPSHARAEFMFRIRLVLCTLAYAGAMVEPLLPISEEETERLRYIYKRAHPERRHQTVFWLPFDDSKSWTYEIMFILQTYLIFVEIIQTTVSATVTPMIVSYMLGQYEILYKYIEMLGRTHRDQYGDIIYYTNFQTGAFVKMNPKINQDMYDQFYCSQLINFHQKLIKFQEMFEKFYSPIMFFKVEFSNIMFALCVYQLTVSDWRSESPGHLCKLILEFIAVAYIYYYLCHCSELLDDAQHRVTVAVASSGWFNCSSATRRDVCMLLRRTQRANHLKFYQGFIILSRAYFWSVVKVSYSYVNFMRMSTSNQKM